jgi:putative transposase
MTCWRPWPFPRRTKLHSTNPLERLNKEAKRRADVVGIFPDEKSILRLIGAVLLEQHDEWQLQHRSLQLAAMAELLQPSTDENPLSLPPTGPCPVSRRDVGAADRAA